jgi:hypothetical protein
MKRQHFFIWTGGNPRVSKECQQMVDALPFLPAPLPLRRAALIHYQWGDAKFEIVASACSVRTTPWGNEQMIWLHGKAVQTASIKPDADTGLINVLIPAHYVTGIAPGPTFRLGRSGKSDDIGVFPPNQPAPEEALPLEHVERILAELLTPERN